MTTILKSGHIYTGPQFHKEGWKPDMTRCRVAVHDGGRWPTYHQCRNKAKVEREVDHHGKTVTLGYCKVHDPIAVAKREAARDAKFKASQDAFRAKIKHGKDGAAAIEIVRQIAAGHNDPRTLALEFLAERDLPLTTGETHG